MTHNDIVIAPSDWHPLRVLVTGYYDGPTDGIIDLGDDIGVYCFTVVAFDAANEIRVLKLARVSSGQLERLLDVVSFAFGPPKWPFWVPICESSNESTTRAAEALDSFCAAGKTVLAALTDDTIERCFAIRKIDDDSASNVSDWLSLFA